MIVIDLSEVRVIEGGGLGMLTFLTLWAQDHDNQFKLQRITCGLRCLVYYSERARRRSMRKWRFPIALCLTQTAVTGVLNLWADRVDWVLGDSNRIPPTFLRVHMLVIELKRVWRGVNAPTLPFNFAGQKRFEILGLSVPEILYLFAVAALWFLVWVFP
jgi:hypothetical protein